MYNILIHRVAVGSYYVEKHGMALLFLGRKKANSGMLLALMLIERQIVET